ncbi:hypothetical protein [Fluviicola sp.]|jgi:hypothetical protein|uniref:hypothetical protein n=1 Tax=Fluviicola sp. TaxID=1917219 RepID=UPI00282A6518|nr:hypothetical protein [Fluviicola sp.]MDR0803021.1 hypothetical protein [Fluviicola sp.]
MQKTEQILEQIKGIRRFQPSAIRNSLVMLLLQLLSFLGTIGLMALSIFYFTKEPEPLSGIMSDIDSLAKIEVESVLKSTEIIIAYMFLCGALLLLLVVKLTKMVRRRNVYILELNKILDKKQTDLIN